MQKIILTFLSLGIVFTSVTSSTYANFIQNTDKAFRYFTNELNFTATPFEVKSIIEGKKEERAIIVDIRSAKDFAKGHIPGAINIPYHDYASFEGSEKEFPELTRDAINYVYCYEFFCNLSQKACKKFASLGYPVKEIKGGFESWKEHNYPIEK